jgi:hypothetical protein
MADPKDPDLSEQLKVTTVKNIPAFVSKIIDYSYRGIVVLIHFINQLLKDAFDK